MFPMSIVRPTMMLKLNFLFFCAILLTLSITASTKVIFFESFDNNFQGRWIKSEAPEYEGEWKHSAAEGHSDKGLLVSQKAKKYAISTSIPGDLAFGDHPVVLQYDLRLQNGQDCGGAYIKYLTPQAEGWKPSELKADTQYSIMFGPDKCGSTDKVHFIFRHKNPKTGEYVEHHLNNPPSPVNDKLTHVYTAIVYPNNTVKILVDGVVKKTADLLSSDFKPPVLPPQTIPDPEDKKPEDWDERAKIVDPDAKKPEDWDESQPKQIVDEDAVMPSDWLVDEPLEIDDPEATLPLDWDEAEDGEWEPPKIPNPKCKEASGCGEWKKPMKKNPKYKGRWKAPMIDNPNYKGKWKPREIDNPDYFHLDRPNLEPISHIGIEIWTMSDGIIFDNILIGDDASLAQQYINSHSNKKKSIEEAIEKKRREKEEQELDSSDKKEEESGKTPLFQGINRIADKLAATKLLSPYKSKIKALAVKAEKYSYVTYFVLAILFLNLVSFVYILIPGGKKTPKDKVAEAKKRDITSPDDVEPSTTEANKAVEDDKGGKDEDEDKPEREIVEEESSQGPTTKRRVRREA